MPLSIPLSNSIFPYFLISQCPSTRRPSTWHAFPVQSSPYIHTTQLQYHPFPSLSTPFFPSNPPTRPFPYISTSFNPYQSAYLSVYPFPSMSTSYNPFSSSLIPHFTHFHASTPFYYSTYSFHLFLFQLYSFPYHSTSLLPIFISYSHITSSLHPFLSFSYLSTAVYLFLLFPFIFITFLSLVLPLELITNIFYLLQNLSTYLIPHFTLFHSFPSFTIA